MNFKGNFSKPFCSNPGGIRSYSFVPVDDVESMEIDLYNFILSEIALKAGQNWLIGYSTFEKLLLSQEAGDSDHGPYFKPFLSGFFPGYNYYIEKLFTHMSYARFVVDVVDNNNERFVLGTIENGMRFSFNYNSGDQIRKLNGYSYRFYQDSATPRLRYNEGAAIALPPVL